jgi:hypothetical protein
MKNSKGFADPRVMKKVADKAQQRVCERSLKDYFRQAWPILEPVTPLVDNWHIDYLSEHLEAAAGGQIKRLLINIPPKSLKSSLVSVMWPTWCGALAIDPARGGCSPPIATPSRAAILSIGAI